MHAPHALEDDSGVNSGTSNSPANGVAAVPAVSDSPRRSSVWDIAGFSPSAVRVCTRDTFRGEGWWAGEKGSTHSMANDVILQIIHSIHVILVLASAGEAETWIEAWGLCFGRRRIALIQYERFYYRYLFNCDSGSFYSADFFLRYFRGARR